MARPPFEPTPEQRRMVKSLSALGIRQEEIALIMEITPPTLRRHFRDELDRGGVEANSQVAQALFKLALAGNVTAMIFWLKSRAGWHQSIPDNRNAGPPPFIVSIDR